MAPDDVLQSVAKHTFWIFLDDVCFVYTIVFFSGFTLEKKSFPMFLSVFFYDGFGSKSVRLPRTTVLGLFVHMLLLPIIRGS